MKKYLIVLSCLFAFSLVNAQDKGSWKTWYENFLKSLKYKVEKKMSPSSKVTAVAAVRGAKQADKSQEVYWKGSNSKKAQDKIEADRKSLKEAVENIVSGDIEKGRLQLKDFIAKNPDSYFITEAKEALEKLPPQEASTQLEQDKSAQKSAPSSDTAVKSDESKDTDKK
ncbi:MAG: hypothetical protein Fur0012_09720 [Elusimicrobiota bacterium]